MGLRVLLSRSACEPLFDPEARLDAMRRRVADYPEALRRAVVQDYLWQAEFDKTALAEIDEFERAPRDFEPRVQQTLGRLGASAAELVAAVESVAQLFRETAELTDKLYQSSFRAPM